MRRTRSLLSVIVSQITLTGAAEWTLTYGPPCPEVSRATREWTARSGSPRQSGLIDTHRPGAARGADSSRACVPRGASGTIVLGL
jgi:hypothetical protein